MKTVIIAIAALAVLGTFATAQCPNNDHCPCATTITMPATVTGSNVGMTLYTQPPCCTHAIGADVWYRFTAPYTGTATASTCGNTNFDTILAIWNYPCANCFACNDDACTFPKSSISFPMTAGSTYQIQLGGFQGATGNFTLTLNGSPPPNDGCAGAMPLSLGTTVFGNNGDATSGPEPLPNCNSSGKDLWYSFVPTVCGTYAASTCVAGVTFMDTVLGVWQGPCGSLTQIACSDDNCSAVGSSLASYATFSGVAGTTYYISVAGWNSSSGAYGVRVDSVPPMGFSLQFFNAGPGTIGFTIANGPLGGLGFMAGTTTFGSYPNGWFFGIDIAMNDLLSQWSNGYPFVSPLNSCGNSTVGPIPGLPPGLVAYGVALGFPPGASFPSVHSAPATGTVP